VIDCVDEVESRLLQKNYYDQKFIKDVITFEMQFVNEENFSPGECFYQEWYYSKGVLLWVGCMVMKSLIILIG
jgi:hypothetical protein